MDRFGGVGLERLGRLDMRRAADLARDTCAGPTSLVLALIYLDRYLHYYVLRYFLPIMWIRIIFFIPDPTLQNNLDLIIRQNTGTVIL